MLGRFGQNSAIEKSARIILLKGIEIILRNVDKKSENRLPGFSDFPCKMPLFVEIFKVRNSSQVYMESVFLYTLHHNIIGI